MINLYLGNTGSGKSLHTAKDIRFALRHGQLVVANFAIDTGKFKIHNDSEFVYLDNKKLVYPYELIKTIRAYQVQHGYRHILVVLDEAHMLFDNRKWNALGRDKWVLFFTHHRKLGKDKIEILLTTQREASIDPKITDIIEYKSYHHKVCNFGTFGFIIGLLTGDRLHHYSTYWGPGRNCQIANKYFFRKKKDSEIYDTYEEFGVFDDIDFITIEKSE